jgi:hypothetical protein
MPKPNADQVTWDYFPLAEDTTTQPQSSGKEYQNAGKGMGPNAAPKEAPRSKMDAVAQGAGNLLAGAVRGAGSIGATLLAPIDMAKDALDGKGVSLESNRQRRADMDSALQTMGAEPESWMYQGGKLAGEIAGTAGAGGVMANGVRAAGATKAMTGLEPITNAIAAGLETGGFRVGELAGTVPGAVARVATGAASGGVSAAMVNPEDAGIGAAIGGAAPAVTKAAGATLTKIGKGMREILGAASPEVRQLATRAQELGINIPADRLLDSKALNAMASSLNYVPLSGRTATEEAMNTQLNRALSRTFGQDTADVSGALRKAGDVLGERFDAVLKSNTVKITPAFKEALAEAENQATNELGPESAAIIHKQIASILTKGAAGEIDGKAAYNIKKTLDRIGQRNTPEAFYARDLKKSLMNALNDSMGAEEAQSFKTLRQQYGNMLALENLAGNGAEGGISVARLANLKHINNPDLQELADIAAQFVKPREAAHGQAQRVFGAGGTGTAAGLSILGVPGAAAAAMAGAGVMGAGRVANKVLNSQAMRNSILKPALQASEPAAMGALAKGTTRALPLLGASATASAQPAGESDMSWDYFPPVEGEVPKNGAQPAQPGTGSERGPVAPDFTSQIRSDGTMAVSGGDAAALSAMLQQAGVPAKSIAPMRDGLLVGRTQVQRVQELLDGLRANPEQPGDIETDVLQGDDLSAAQSEAPGTEFAALSEAAQPQVALHQPEYAPATVFTSQPRSDGTLAVQGDAKALREVLLASGIPSESIVPIPGGILVGRSQAGNVQNAIDALHAQSTQEVQGAEQNQASDFVDTAQAATDVVADGGLHLPEQASIDLAAHAAATSPQNDLPEPTPAQQKAGNYRLGHDRISGMDVSIENPQGSVRRGVDADGVPWETQMQHHYGYFKNTTANDGDKLDVFIKPGTPKDYAGPVFVIDQVDPRTGKLDEHKTILGAKDEAEAKAIYKANYSADWNGMGSITRLPMPAFKAWATNGDKRHPLGDLQAPPDEPQATAMVEPQTQPVEHQEQVSQQDARLATIQRLRDAGEESVATRLQGDYDHAQTLDSVRNELAAMQASNPDAPHHASPAFSAAYQQRRLAGVKPAEASAQAGVMAAVQDIAPKIGLSDKAVNALMAKLDEIPIDRAPVVVERFAKSLMEKGVIQRVPGGDQIAAIVQESRDSAMHDAVGALYAG